MKKLLSFTTLLSILFLALFSIIPNLVLADGMVLELDPYSDRWDYSGENNQQAFIDYNNGLQKMIISIGLEDENTKDTVWLFPIPANPDDVTVDVVRNFPRLHGVEIHSKVRSSLGDTIRFLRSTQLYAIPFDLSSQARNITSNTEKNFSTIPEGINKKTEPDIVVHQHLVKEGISSEVVTAKTTDHLYGYLKGKGLKIENDSIPVLQNYVGKDYSFVVSWISSQNENISSEEIKNNLITYYQNRPLKFFKLINNLERRYPEFRITNKQVDYLKSQQGAPVLQELVQAIQNDPSIIVGTWFNPQNDVDSQKGVSVTFPTEKIYFPLLPTSVYGGKIVPATIRVIGHVSPDIFQDIKSYTKTEYFLGQYPYFADDVMDFNNTQNQNVKYTKIEINAPSSFFTDDLWIDNYAPAKIKYLSLLVGYPLIVKIILLVLCSIIVGIFAGLVVFKDLRRKPARLALIGLSNCFTMLGLLIVTILSGTKKNNEDEHVESLLSEIKQKGYFWKRKAAVLLFIAMIPSSTFGLLVLPEFIQEFSVDGIELIIDDFVPTFIIYILPILVLFTAFGLKKIKIEDKNLFNQLREAGYSSWSFYPKDKRKYYFVPIFSILFLIISWSLIEMIKIAI